MNDEHWGDLKEKLHERFGDVKESVEDESHEDDIGHNVPTKKEVLEFTSPMGELRIERVSRPKIIDKKTHYHKGAGQAKVEYVLSRDEYVHNIDVYKKDDTGEWLKMDLPTERLSF